MLVDEVRITVKAGDGGNGCLAFRREKYVPHGGPSGGDGGHGGDITMVATVHRNTLLHFRFNPEYTAQRGRHGEGSNKTGHDGESLTIQVPVGTVAVDEETGETLFDFTEDGQTWVAAKGGRGGKGNARFASSTHQTPTEHEGGKPGEFKKIQLKLKLLADVGLVGYPNAGKSTLIRAVSAARPKVAGYPFTTLHPNLGVVSVGLNRSFVMADIPGLIEGAADGAGLGIRFLKHLQRTRVLLHLVDVSPPDPDADPVKDARAIVAELKKFNPELATRERWLVLNKVDLFEPGEAAKRCKDIVRRLRFKGPVFQISGATGEGTKRLCEALMTRLEERAREAREAAAEAAGQS